MRARKAAGIVAAALLASSCASMQPAPAGAVVVVWHATPAAQVDAACRARLITSPDVLYYRACSWFDQSGAFHIIAADVRGVDDCAAMRRLGHELVHAYRPQWHRPDETAKPGPCT